MNRLRFVMPAIAAIHWASPVLAQSPRLVAEAGSWKEVTASGLRTYSTANGSGSLEIGCDEARSLDHRWTGISIEIGGLLPPQSQLRFVVDGRSISIPSGKSGGVATAGCPECAGKFAQLWRQLRSGSRLEVVASDGRRAVFSLDGAAELMPAGPCPTAP